MERRLIAPRANLADRMQARAFEGVEQSFDSPYWRDDVYYKFTAKQVDELDDATNELYKMCLHAVEHVIKTKQLDKFGIPAEYHLAIERAWQEKKPDMYGRFDFAYDGKSPPKMLEFNADTPTSLYEASVLQWDWLEDRRASGDAAFARSDQFNSIHERLVAAWKKIGKPNTDQPIHFACHSEALEDYCTTAYMEETAYQAGHQTRLIDMEDVGVDEDNQFAYTHEDKGEPISTLFKLYPWEWMLREEFGKLVPDAKADIIEPIWKSVLSNKHLLPVLWQLYPNHPNLLPAYETPDAFAGKPYVKKAVFGREGANVEIVDAKHAERTDGIYDDSGYIYQAFHSLPEFYGKFPVIGSWVVGGEAAGMGIREDDSRITKNTSRFVPHMFTP